MKIFNSFNIVIAVCLAIMLSSCGGPKKVSAGEDQVEVVLPFSTPEYKSDADFFRSVALGKSPDQATAKKIAMMNARAEIAAAISTKVKSVSDQYVKQVSIGEKQDYVSKFEELTRTVVNQELSDVAIKNEKLYKDKNGTFTYYVAVEMGKAVLKEALVSEIEKDAKTKLDFDKFTFEKIFDSAMKAE
jgi:hypothetical protein